MSLPPEPWPHRDALRALDDALTPGADAVGTVIAGVEPLRRRRRTRRRVLRAATAGIAAATLGLVLWAANRQEAPARLALDSPAEASTEPLAGLRLVHEGQGTLDAAGGRLRIDWQEGRLGVDLDPSADRALEVRTPEARIEVLGTAFSVDRDGLGTLLVMERGEVATWCHGRPGPRCTAGSTWRCHRSAAAALHAARTLQGEGAPPARILGVVEQGMAIPEPSQGTREELEVLRIALLADAVDPAAALAAARAYLATGTHHRREEVQLLATDLEGTMTPAP